MKRIYVETKKRLECVDIRARVNIAIKELSSKKGKSRGICNIFTPHATAAIAIIENYDRNICIDFHAFLEKEIPKGVWLHDRIDGNGDSHIKAAIIGPSETIPFEQHSLCLGRWQSVVLVELDGPRKREVVVSVV